MERLINAFRKCPSPSNRAKLEKYMQRHMMALALCTPEQIAFLKVHGFNV
jgi:hypothetical protein